MLMTDVGTRIQHLTDLYDLWSDGLAILERGTYHTPFEQKQIEDLKASLRLLGFHMMKDSVTQQTEYARVINNLPRAEDIHGLSEEDAT